MYILKKLIPCLVVLYISFEGDLWKCQGARNATNSTTEWTKALQERTEFIKYWNLHRETRFDFQKVLEPCRHELKWKSFYSERTPYLITSANLSGVELDIKPAGQYSRILIESFSLMNTRKTVGGDSWRVFVKGVRSVPSLTIGKLNFGHIVYIFFAST